MPGQTKRVGPKKTFENIGGVSTHLLAGAIWFEARGRIGGSARLDFGGPEVDFFAPEKIAGKKASRFFCAETGPTKFGKK